MRNSLLDELGLKTEYDQKHRIQNIELNVTDMRIKMRRENYLTHPDVDNVINTLGGEELSESILQIQDIAVSTRQENILQVMNRSTFFGKNSAKKYSFFDNEPDGPDFEEQIRILISSIEDKKDMDQIYRYWQSEKKKRDYSEETFLDNLITNKIYSYSDSDINI